MAVYIGYLILAGIQVPLFVRRDILGNQLFYVRKYLAFCCLELLFLVGLRGYTVGADTRAYLNAIDYYKVFSFWDLLKAELVYPFDFEPGYFWLMKLSILLGLEKTGFLFLVAIITYIPVFLTIKNHSSMPYISILCYFAFGFFSHSLGIFRQVIAMSILLLGWNYVEERRFGRYFLLVCLAMSMHSTAIVGILFYVLYGIKWELVILWLLPIEAALLFFGRAVVLLILRVLPMYSGYLGGMHDIQGGTYLMLILLNIVLFANLLTKNKAYSRNDDMIITALVLAVCLQCVGYSFGLMGRAVTYYSIYMILAIPNVIGKLEDNKKHIVAIFVILGLYALIYREFDGNKFVVPYYTVFN